MNTKSIVGAVAALSALSALVFGTMNVGSRPAATTVHDQPDTVQPAQRSFDGRSRELASMKERISSLEDELRALSQREPEPARPVADESALEAKAPKPVQDPSPAAVHERIEEQLLDQEVDAAWAPKAEQSLASFFAALPPTTAQLTEVECRKTLCKLRLHFAGESARGRFEAQYLGEPPFDQGVFLHPDEATGELLMYTQRAGGVLATNP